jgi:hypothetical protein
LNPLTVDREASLKILNEKYHDDSQLGGNLVILFNESKGQALPAGILKLMPVHFHRTNPESLVPGCQARA